MRHFRICLLPIAALLALGGCGELSALTTGATTTPPPATTTTPSVGSELKEVACAIDGVIQPIAAATLATLVPGGQLAVDLDTGLIHPAIVAWCAQNGGTATTTTVAPAPASPAVTVAPTTASPAPAASASPGSPAAPAGAPAGAVSPPAPAGAVPGTTLTEHP